MNLEGVPQPIAVPATNNGMNAEQLNRFLANPTTAIGSYPEKLAFDTALVLENKGDPYSEIPKEHPITVDDFTQLMLTDVFKHALIFYRDYIAREGITFKMKAQILADNMLTDMSALIRNPEAAASAKVTLFQHITKLAGYVPETGAGRIDVTGDGAGGGFSLNIVMNNNVQNVHNVKPDVPALDKQRVIEGEVVDEPQASKMSNNPLSTTSNRGDEQSSTTSRERDTTTGRENTVPLSESRVDKKIDGTGSTTRTHIPLPIGMP